MTRPPLLMPVLLKEDLEQSWPDVPAFYLLTRDGLFVCRNHPYFRSCVPATECPGELAGQEPFLEARFPRLSRGQLELIVGFFSLVAELHDAEAAVLLLWDDELQRVRLHVPRQVTARRGLGVRYAMPDDLPPHQRVFGDVHSHVDASAHASGIDVADEQHSAGLHVVVGRIRREPPEFHVEAVVDGARFRLPPRDVVGPYQRRRNRVPREWLECVTVQAWSA